MMAIAMVCAQWVERAKLGWWRSPVRMFLRWWGGELIAMLPARARDWVRRGPAVLWLAADAGGITVRRARMPGRAARVAADLPATAQRAEFAKACRDVDPDDRRLVLVVPVSQLLVRRLVMPAAAVADPRRVVGYEVDRQTPFNVAQVYYDVRVSADTTPAGYVAFDLFVAPRAALDPLLTRCAAIGAHPDAVDAEIADGVLAGIDLLPPERRPRRVDRRRLANAIIAAGCVLLVVLALSQWLDNRRQALVTMQQEVHAMRTQAARSDQLRAQLLGAIAASKFLVKRKAETPSALAVLDDLTRRLPSTAWLNSMTLDDAGDLDIKGEAPRAAALVNKLGDSRVLEEPQLRGMIQPDPATGKERFELTAQVRKRGDAGAH